ncbi:MAG: winged helix-turn-helix domain-containing protein [Gemmatimonadetes bacterium]|nr:winged helix-turn-helix domain-containing protein [Gemmatimonadota bacterium]
MTVRLSGNGLPRISILFARQEPVEPLIRWLSGAGYALTELHYTVVEDLHARIPDSDLLLIQTDRPRSVLPFVMDELRSRGFRHAPAVMVLTGADVIGDLDVTRGIDDFICAPYNVREFDLRIKNVLWRRHSVQIQDMIAWGDLLINLGNYEVTIRGKAIDLTLKEYELLKHLARHRGRVFTRDELLTAVWGYDYFSGTRTVDVHVRRLRMKIERHGVHIITTVRGVGYKFGD